MSQAQLPTNSASCSAYGVAGSIWALTFDMREGLAIALLAEHAPCCWVLIGQYLFVRELWSLPNACLRCPSTKCQLAQRSELDLREPAFVLTERVNDDQRIGLKQRLATDAAKVRLEHLLRNREVRYQRTRVGERCTV